MPKTAAFIVTHPQGSSCGVIQSSAVLHGLAEVMQQHLRKHGIHFSTVFGNEKTVDVSERIPQKDDLFICLTVEKVMADDTDDNGDGTGAIFPGDIYHIDPNPALIARARMRELT